MSEKVALITGVTGQDGSLLARLLLDKGYVVKGTVARITRVGFEVRIEVDTGPQVVLVTMTRTELAGLGAQVGDTVWARVVPGAPTVVAVTPLATGTDAALDEADKIDA